MSDVRTVPAITLLTPVAVGPGVVPYDEWVHRAACRGKIVKDDNDDDQWHPKRKSDTGAGKTICNGPKESPELACPVREECLAWALATKQAVGTWGGKDAWELHEIYHPGVNRWRRRVY
jgi:hypothetical protein